MIIERADIGLGGAERSVFELSRQLELLGVSVTVLAAKGGLEASNVKVLCGHIGGKRTPFYVYENSLQEYLAQNKFDIVHSTLPFTFADVYQPRGGSYTEAMLQNAASYENKAIAFIKRWSHWINSSRSQMINAERMLCRDYPDVKIAALSEYTKGHFIRNYGVAEERIAVIPNAVKVIRQVNENEVDKLRSRIMSMLDAREADGPRLFLFAANNFRLKGLDWLIRAVERAVRHYGAGKVYVVAAGAGKAGKYRKLAKKLGMEGRVAFLGKLGHIQDVLEVCDAAVLPTWYDPSSRFILEALARGKPVITTKFNGAAEMFTDGRHGIIVDRPDNVDGLAKGLVFFADYDNVKQASDVIIGDRLVDNISIERHGKAMIELYESILRDRI